MPPSQSWPIGLTHPAGKTTYTYHGIIDINGNKVGTFKCSEGCAVFCIFKTGDDFQTGRGVGSLSQRCLTSFYNHTKINGNKPNHLPMLEKVKPMLPPHPPHPVLPLDSTPCLLFLQTVHTAGQQTKDMLKKCGELQELLLAQAETLGVADTCSICTDPITKDIETMSCGHTYHQTCIFQWFKQKKSCPICRVVLIGEEVRSC